MKRLPIIIFLLLLFITLYFDFFVKQATEYDKVKWNEIPGIWSIFGFLGCVILILFSKYIYKTLFQRREDYYD